MTLAAGTRLGSYEILSPIGAGGMGEVYRARDTKLGRDVAIKVLPEKFAREDERLARFEREAKLLASLNHPNIASIYGLEESARVKAIVLELVEGATLAERIAEGPIPVEEAIVIAERIAEALEAGHAAGIIHRDLKPANVKVREDGTVKLLDYGLAKALSGDGPAGTSAELSQSPTLTRQSTEVGVILGTAAYMSPEQAKGKRCDRRADVWAFGAVVYEMLAGKRAFAGEDVSETLASVLAKEPDWEALPRETPSALRRVLKLCLTKDAKERVHDIADVRLGMRGAFETSSPPVAVSGSRLAMVVVAAAAALLGALMAAVTLSSWRAQAPASASPARVSVMVPANRPLGPICYPCKSLSLSPDGTRLVYRGENLDAPPDEPGMETASRTQLFLRSLASLAVRDLPGTEDGNQPFFSPDGQWVGFFTGTGELKKVSLSGGTPVTLVEKLNGSRWRFGVWTEEDTIIFDSDTGLRRVSAEGGEATNLTTLDAAAGDQFHRFPALVPGSRAVLFTVGYGDTDRRERIEAVRLDSGERRVVVENARMALALASGHLLFQRDQAILVAPFDTERWTLSGTAVPLVDEVRFDSTTRSSIPLAQLSVSGTGTLAYLPSDERPGTLGLVSRDGAFEPLRLPPGHAETPRASPDGRAIAFIEAHGSDSEVRVYDLARGSSTKVGSAGNIRWLAWHPDSRSVAVVGTRARDEILSRKLDGDEEVLVGAPENSGLRDFSFRPDGTQIAHTVQNGSQYDIWVNTIGPTPSPEPFLESAAAEYGPAFSPDGQWLAYVSDASGRAEVYVQRYPRGERFAVSTEGGSGPVWSPNAREIFFEGISDGKEKLMAVSVTPDGDALRLGVPAPLFELRRPDPTGAIEEYVSSSVSGTAYDILPDGNHFVMVRRAAERGAREIVLVQNWLEELKARSPTND